MTSPLRVSASALLFWIALSWLPGPLGAEPPVPALAAPDRTALLRTHLEELDRAWQGLEAGIYYASTFDSSTHLHEVYDDVACSSTASEASPVR